MSRNRQSGNVGNLGDIIKHSLLVELAPALAALGRPVSFVDTNTFLLHAPLANEARWLRDTEARLAMHPAHGRYVELERASLAKTGDYRCSSGLVLDVLGGQRACAVLGEANGRTRVDLKDQIAEEGHADVHVVEDASEVDRGGWVAAGSSLLVHVDPFSLTPEVWRPMAPALDAIAARAAAAVFVLYRYSRSAWTEWPRSPTGTVLVAETRAQPHEIAVCASPALSETVALVCGSFGFRARPR